LPIGYYSIPYFDILAGKPEEVKRLPGGKVKKKVCFGILECNLHLILNVYDYNYTIIWLMWSDAMFSFQDKQEVIIEKVVRNKRKSITTVKGLELFGEFYFSFSYFFFGYLMIICRIEWNRRIERNKNLFQCFEMKWNDKRLLTLSVFIPYLAIDIYFFIWDEGGSRY
jgi:hypothetical protein